MSSWHTALPRNYVTELIYDSSATANNKNIFSDYDKLIAHINNDLGGARVRISLRQDEILPARTSQNWNGITWSGNGNPASLGGLTLTLPDTFTVSSWTNALIDGGLNLKSVSTTPIMTISSLFLFSMLFANVISCTQCEFFRLTGSVQYMVLGVGGGSVVKANGYEVVNLYSNYPILVTSISGPNANIEANTIRGTVGLFFNQYADAGSAITAITNTHANFSGTTSTTNLVEASNLDWEAKSIATDTTTGLKIGTSTTQKLGFFNATPIVQPAEITDELTSITHTAPGTPDYAVQDLTNIGGYGFVTKDEGNTVLSVIANLQTRNKAIEDALHNLGLLADAD